MPKFTFTPCRLHKRPNICLYFTFDETVSTNTPSCCEFAFLKKYLCVTLPLISPCCLSSEVPHSQAFCVTAEANRSWKDNTRLPRLCIILTQLQHHIKALVFTLRVAVSEKRAAGRFSKWLLCFFSAWSTTRLTWADDKTSFLNCCSVTGELGFFCVWLPETWKNSLCLTEVLNASSKFRVCTAPQKLPFLQLFCKTFKFRCAFPVYSTRLLCAFIRKLSGSDLWWKNKSQACFRFQRSSQEGGAAVKLPDLCFNLQRSTRPRDPHFSQNNQQKKKKRNMGCLSHDCFFLPSNIKTCLV